MAENYYILFIQSLDLFLAAIPYGIPLSRSFVDDASERIKNKLKVNSLCVTNGTHRLSNDVQ